MKFDQDKKSLEPRNKKSQMKKVVEEQVQNQQPQTTIEFMKQAVENLNHRVSQIE